MASTPETGAKVVLVAIGDDTEANERPARRIVLVELAPSMVASRAAHPSSRASRN